jgi:outer membrane protein assembly factor BamB
VAGILGGGLWLWVLLGWFWNDPTSRFVENVPGMDGEPLGASTSVQSTDNVRIGEFFKLFTGIKADIAGQWPGFRGVNGDNISTDKTPLRQNWTGAPPRILWSVTLGEGHAAPAVADGRVFVLDYDETEDADALRCFSLADGAEIWRRWYPIKIKRNHGMSRTIPAVSDSFLVTIGPRCQVMCVRPATGDLLWGIDLTKSYGTEVPMWYTGQCPLIDDSIAVIAPGGSDLLVGIDCRNGAVVWRTPNPRQWKMSHSSIVPMVVDGQKIYLYCALGGLVGVAADGPRQGAMLFETSEFNQSVVAPSPVVLDKGRIFVTAGYGAGSMLFQVQHDNGVFSIVSLEKLDVRAGLASEQQTPLFYKGHLFAVLPKDAGERRNQFACVSQTDPGTILWSSGPRRRFGLGPYLIADDKFLLLSDEGSLTVAQATAQRFEELATYKLLDGVDAWGPMAIVAGRLLLRDAGAMICVDLTAPQN